MEMNLYGVASIRLDKMRGLHIKKVIQTVFLIYSLVLVASLLLPDRLVSFDLGEAALLESPKKDMIFRFRKTFKLSDAKLNDFEIIVSSLTATEINFNDAHKKMASFFKDHQVTMNIRWFETKSEITKNQFLQDSLMTEN